MAITSDNGFYLYEGSPTKFDNTLVVILCPVKVEKDDVIRVDVEVWDDVDNTVFYGSHPLVFTEAEVEAYTGSGTGEFSLFKNCVEQAVVDYLEGVTENSGIVFTIV